MEQSAKPIQVSGVRNILCPFYSQCLDFAAKRHWHSWACHACPHKSKQQSYASEPFMTGDSVPYYTISSDIYQKVI